MNLEVVDWNSALTALNAQGFAQLDGILSEAECQTLIAGYDDPHFFRKTILMERYRFGSGEYKYFQHPLPDTIQHLRSYLYEKLQPLAKHWNELLKLGQYYPPQHAEFLAHCAAHEQTLATPLVLRYGVGGFNTLHQDLYGSVYFPFQAVIFLNQHGRDFSGGEFVITEQIPRAQSKASVLSPAQGSVLLFTTHSRPKSGARGHYRAQLKHGVSTVHSGQRHTLGIIFHDAT